MMPSTFALVRGHKLDVIAAGESQMAITVLIGDIAEIPDEIDTDDTGISRPYGIDLIPGFGDVLEHARFQDLMVFPVSIILFYDLRNHLSIIRGTNICFRHVQPPPSILDFRYADSRIRGFMGSSRSVHVSLEPWTRLDPSSHLIDQKNT